MLEEAAKSKVDSVVFCLISGAIFNDANLPQETIAEEIVQGVEELLQKPTWKDWQFARTTFNNFPGKSMIPGKGGAQAHGVSGGGKAEPSLPGRRRRPSCRLRARAAATRTAPPRRRMATLRWWSTRGEVNSTSR